MADKYIVEVGSDDGGKTWWGRISQPDGHHLMRMPGGYNGNCATEEDVRAWAEEMVNFYRTGRHYCKYVL